MPLHSLLIQTVRMSIYPIIACHFVWVFRTDMLLQIIFIQKICINNAITNFTACNSLRIFFFCSKIKNIVFLSSVGQTSFTTYLKWDMYHNFIFCVELSIFLWHLMKLFVIYCDQYDIKDLKWTSVNLHYFSFTCYLLLHAISNFRSEEVRPTHITKSSGQNQ